jgi:hypothetical protein
VPDKEVHITVKTFVIFAILLGSGCGENKRTAHLEENNSALAKSAKENTKKGTQSKVANKNSVAAKQVKELILEELIVGVYELNLKTDSETIKIVLKEGGEVEDYINDKKVEEGKWKIMDWNLHTEYKDGSGGVSRINPDGTLTLIATIKNGERINMPTNKQINWEQIR